MRVPVASKMALANAGAIAGVPGSPAPPLEAVECGFQSRQNGVGQRGAIAGVPRSPAPPHAAPLLII